jgi:isoquinoline 1-oxidoreductase beta subunit
MSNADTKRRAFLRRSTTVGATYLLGFHWPLVGRAMDRGIEADGASFAPNAFIRIAPDDTVTIVVPKSEMGQGVLTALPQIVAEELDVEWERVRYEQSPAHPDYNRPGLPAMLTGGSTSVRTSWDQLRRAGASARAMLVAAATDTWRLDAGELRTLRGVVYGPNGRRARYSELAAKAARMPVPQNVTLKDRSDWRIIGRSVLRLDTPAKLNGQAKFGIDIQLPGMLTAMLVRSPVFGASVRTLVTDKAMALPGVHAVLRTSLGVAVVADGFWSAKQARGALSIEWTEAVGSDLNSTELAENYAAMAAGEGIVARREGDLAQAQAHTTVRAQYVAPFLAHACMEPMNCVAWVTPERVRLWVGTQAQTHAQVNAAQIAGIPPEQVEVNTTLLGGGFGRRAVNDYVIAATEIAKQMRVPVKLIYTREDDTRGWYYRPASHTELSAGLDARGRPVWLHGKVVVPSMAESTGFKRLIRADGVDRVAVEGLADLPYAIEHLRVDWIKPDAPLPIWFWRSVGATHNTFATESFVDEMAHAAGRDPVEFRLSLLDKHPRHQAVLRLAAERAGWGGSLPPGRARGVALIEVFAGWCAQVAEVSLQDGRVRVHRVVCAADAGTVVNPEQVKAQMESAIVYGLSAALYGEITVRDGRVVEGNFDTYPVLRMAECPAIEVHLVASTEPPGGVGEPGTPPIAPAVANALFALTGKRARSLPFAKINWGGANT